MFDSSLFPFVLYAFRVLFVIFLKKVKTVMVSNSTNINKTNNNLLS